MVPTSQSRDQSREKWMPATVAVCRDGDNSVALANGFDRGFD